MITAIRFFYRNDGFLNVDITSLQINLSTTSKGPDGLSTVFSENIGANETVVFGPRPARFGPGSPLPEYTFQLDEPFFYDPSAGNLLMDVRNFSGGLGPMMG